MRLTALQTILISRHH